MKVAFYMRVSTSRQALEGDSLEEQDNELTKYCEAMGYVITKKYVDHKSGKDTNRPQFQEMLADGKVGKFQAILVKKLDRFSRSLLDFEATMQLLQDHEVAFVSLKDNFDTSSAMGNAMLRIALVFAQLEREQSAERIKEVMYFRATSGLRNGGFVPFGYSVVNGELVVYPKEQKLVETIFNEFIQTESTAAVADMLNKDGIPARNGKPWDIRVLANLLQNKVYIGKMKWRGEYFQGTHAPIITENTFQQAADILYLNRRNKQVSASRALLQTLLVCGHCNTLMTPSFSYSRTKQKYYYYLCSTARNKKDHPCPHRRINRERLHNSLLGLLTSQSPISRITELANIHNAKQDTIITTLTDQRHQLATQLATIKAKRDNYLDSLVGGKFSDEERLHLNKRLTSLEEEETTLKRQDQKLDLDILEAKEHKIPLTELKAKFIDLAVNSKDYTPKQLKNWLHITISSIHYHGPELLIKFKGVPDPISFNTIPQ